MIYKDENLEIKLLSRMIQSNESAILSMDLLHENYFTSYLTKKVFNVVKSSLNESINVDIILIESELRKGNFDVQDYLRFLTPVFIDVKNACFVLKELYMKSEAKMFNLELSNKITENSDALALVDFIGDKYQEISQHSIVKKQRLMSDITADVIQQMEDAIEGVHHGLKTFLHELDYQTGLWANGHLITIAGRPAMGKTTLALQIAINLAKQGERVVFISLEMSDTPVALKLMSNISGVNSKKIQEGIELSQEEIQKVHQAKKFLDSLDFHIIKMSSPTLEDVKMALKRIHISKPISIAFVDYLQLMSGAGGKTEVVTKNSEGLKGLALDLECPIVQLAQLNRAVESRPDKIPTLADLKDSGSIEQDSDKVIFPFRPEYYDFEEFEGEPTEGKLYTITAKNRQGKTGTRAHECDLSTGLIQDEIISNDLIFSKTKSIDQPISNDVKPKNLDDIPF